MAQNIPSLRTQSTWLLSAKLIGFGFAFLLPLIVVRFLTQDNVGLYRQSFQVVMNAVSILPFGFSMSAYYFLSRFPERGRSTVLNILIFNFIVGGVTFLLLFAYPQLLSSLFRSDEIGRLSPMIGVVIWLWMIAAFLEVVAVANREPRVAMGFIVISQLTKTILMTAAVILFSTVDAFLYAAMVQGTLQVVVLVVYLHRRFPEFWKAFDFDFFREQIFYALPFGVASMVLVMQTDVHNYFVGYKFSAADYAVYAYGCFQLPVLIMLHESINSVLIPRISELQLSGSRDEIVRLSVRATEKLAFIYFPVFAFLLISAPLFITTLFTDKFAASTPIFMINLAMLIIDVVVLDAIFRAFKELGRALLYIRVGVLAVLLSVLYFGLDHLTLSAMIAVVVAATLGERLISGTLVAKKLKLRRGDLHRFAGITRTAAASIIAGAVLLAFTFLGSDFLEVTVHDSVRSLLGPDNDMIAHFAAGSILLSLYGVVFGSVYLFCANYLGVIDEHEKAYVRGMFRRLAPSRKPIVNARLTFGSDR